MPTSCDEALERVALVLDAHRVEEVLHRVRGHDHRVVALGVGGLEGLAAHDHARLAREQAVARDPVDRDRILPVGMGYRLRHRSSAIATRSSRPAASSSSREFCRRWRRTERISARGPPVHEDDEAEAVLLLVGLVQLRENGEEHRVLVGALLPRGLLGDVHALADAWMRPQRLDLLVLGCIGEHLARLAEGILELGQLLHEARMALEELGELVFAQLPR